MKNFSPKWKKQCDGLPHEVGCGYLVKKVLAGVLKQSVMASRYMGIRSWS